MKIQSLDRKYELLTGKRTSIAFVHFDDGSEVEVEFPDYPIGSSVVLIDEKYYLEDIDRTCYTDESLINDTIQLLRANASFFYRVCNLLSYERYEKLTREIPDIAKRFKENPYILCEKEDEDGQVYIPFQKLDSVVNLKSFEMRKLELKMAATMILKQNEQRGNTWMTYESFAARFAFILKYNGHPLQVGNASAILNFFPEFYVDLPLTPQSRVAFQKTKSFEYYIERTIRQFIHVPTLFGRYRPPMTLEGLTEEQMEAIRGAILSDGRLSILTGGPGVGKTTVISQIVDGIQNAYPTLEIRLLAPTGKASKRIKEQMGEREVEVSTIHKFLGYGKKFISKEDRDEVKKSGLVIIDESSMVDVEIFYQLLIALDMSKTKIILVGDEDQLPSIGAGDILHDFIKMGIPTFRLTMNFRNTGLIHENAQKIIRGEIDLEQDDYFMIDEKSPTLGWLFAGVDMENDIIVVPYHSEKKNGSVPEINRIAQNRRKLTTRIAQYNVGDIVICLKNNYKQGYLNGDIGFYRGKTDGVHEVLIGEQSISVLDEDLELGYAITIHKSQGSEYPILSICIPEYNSFITRRMFYTAVSRAKERVRIYAKWHVINRIILNNKDEARQTFLGTLCES